MFLSPRLLQTALAEAPKKKLEFATRERIRKSREISEVIRIIGKYEELNNSNFGWKNSIAALQKMAIFKFKIPKSLKKLDKSKGEEEGWREVPSFLKFLLKNCRSFQVFSENNKKNSTENLKNSDFANLVWALSSLEVPWSLAFGPQKNDFFDFLSKKFDFEDRNLKNVAIVMWAHAKSSEINQEFFEKVELKLMEENTEKVSKTFVKDSASIFGDRVLSADAGEIIDFFGENTEKIGKNEISENNENKVLSSTVGCAEEAREIANIFWALEKLEYAPRNPDFFQNISKKLLENSEKMNPQDVANVLTASAHFLEKKHKKNEKNIEICAHKSYSSGSSFREEEGKALFFGLFETSKKIIFSENCSLQHLSNIAWSYAKMLDFLGKKMENKTEKGPKNSRFEELEAQKNSEFLEFLRFFQLTSELFSEVSRKVSEASLRVDVGPLGASNLLYSFGVLNSNLCKMAEKALVKPEINAPDCLHFIKNIEFSCSLPPPPLVSMVQFSADRMSASQIGSTLWAVAQMSSFSSFYKVKLEVEGQRRGLKLCRLQENEETNLKNLKIIENIQEIALLSLDRQLSWLPPSLQELKNSESTFFGRIEEFSPDQVSQLLWALAAVASFREAVPQKLQLFRKKNGIWGQKMDYSLEDSEFLEAKKEVPGSKKAVFLNPSVDSLLVGNANKISEFLMQKCESNNFRLQHLAISCWSLAKIGSLQGKTQKKKFEEIIQNQQKILEKKSENQGKIQKNTKTSIINPGSILRTPEKSEVSSFFSESSSILSLPAALSKMFQQVRLRRLLEDKKILNSKKVFLDPKNISQLFWASTFLKNYDFEESYLFLQYFHLLLTEKNFENLKQNPENSEFFEENDDFLPEKTKNFKVYSGKTQNFENPLKKLNYSAQHYCVILSAYGSSAHSYLDDVFYDFYDLRRSLREMETKARTKNFQENEIIKKIGSSLDPSEYLEEFKKIRSVENSLFSSFSPGSIAGILWALSYAQKNYFLEFENLFLETLKKVDGLFFSNLVRSLERQNWKPESIRSFLQNCEFYKNHQKIEKNNFSAKKQVFLGDDASICQLASGLKFLEVFETHEEKIFENVNLEKLSNSEIIILADCVSSKNNELFPEKYQLLEEKKNKILKILLKFLKTSNEEGVAQLGVHGLRDRFSQIIFQKFGIFTRIHEKNEKVEGRASSRTLHARGEIRIFDFSKIKKDIFSEDELKNFENFESKCENLNLFSESKSFSALPPSSLPDLFFKKKFSAFSEVLGGHQRSHHAEVSVLFQAFSFLEKKVGKNVLSSDKGREAVGGVLRLRVEGGMYPCVSCVFMIFKFQRLFPSLKVVVEWEER